MIFVDNHLYKMIASNGMLLIDDVLSHNLPGYGIVIRENTIINTWIDKDGNNLIDFFNISGKTLRVTDPALIIPESKKNGSITLNSGSIWLLL